MRSISAERQRKGDVRRKRKCDFAVNLQGSRRPEGRRPGVGPSARRGRAGRPRTLGEAGTGPGRGRRPYLRLHCKTPVAGAPGSSCRRRPGAAASPAAGGRAPAAGCGPRRPWRAGARGAGLGGRRGCAGAGLWARRGRAGLAALRGHALRTLPALARANFPGFLSRAGEGARGAAARRRVGAARRASEGARATGRRRPPLPSMDACAAGAGRAGLLLRSEACRLRPPVAGGQCGSGSSRPPPPRAPPAPPALPQTGLCCARTRRHVWGPAAAHLAPGRTPQPPQLPSPLALPPDRPRSGWQLAAPRGP